MRVLTGTSGWSYAEWRGLFYPRELDAGDMLGFYGSRLATVEINNTFYRMPKAELLERWASAVPATFRFALKAPRRISHVRRLKNAREDLGFFLHAAEALGQKFGPVLFQLPPFARKDADVLRDFLTELPKGARAAFEFRHPSWFDDEIYALLSEYGAALCGGDSDESDRSPPLVPTARFGYLRLRAPSYDAASLGAWADKLRAQPFEEAYVYLKHEVDGPAYAAYLDALLGDRPLPDLPEGAAPASAGARTEDSAGASASPTKKGRTRRAKKAPR